MASFDIEIPPPEYRLYQCVKDMNSNITLCKEGSPTYLIHNEFHIVTIPSFIPKSADSMILKVAVGRLNTLRIEK